MPQKEYKAALARAAGLVVAQRSNTLPFRNDIAHDSSKGKCPQNVELLQSPQHQETEPGSSSATQTSYTVSPTCSLKRQERRSDMSSFFVDPDASRAHWLQEPKSRYVLSHSPETVKDDDEEEVQEDDDLGRLMRYAEREIMDMFPKIGGGGATVRIRVEHGRFSFESSVSTVSSADSDQTSAGGTTNHEDDSSESSSISSTSNISIHDHHPLKEKAQHCRVTTPAPQSVPTQPRRQTTKHWHCATTLTRKTNTTSQPLPTDAFDKLCMYIALSPSFQEAIDFASSPSLPHSMPPSSLLELPFPAPTELYRSICICDPKIPGMPIYARSKHFSLSPRVIRVAQCQFANTPSDRQADGFTMSVRIGADARPRFVVEYTMSMTSVETGVLGWVMCAAVDVMCVVETLAKEWVEEGGVWPGLRNDNEADCDDDHDGGEQVDWPSIASSTACHTSTPTPAQESTKESILDISPSSKAALHTLLRRLRSMYLTGFILTPTPNRSFWQISHTSPSLFSSSSATTATATAPQQQEEGNREDIQIAFSHSDLETLRALEDALAADEPKMVEGMAVNWGVDGVERELWAVPMIRGGGVGNGNGNGVVGWLCLLL